MDESNASPSTSTEVAWKPLTAKQRRVLGTLMEKSKTTPDAYPMTYSGLVTGCNQKSNRAPITHYDSDQIEAIVDELRSLGAATIVQGNGRVTKVRHYAYQWLGISKVEGAIMTELLLRGEQTIGELRTRASRMEPIADLDELKRLLDALKARNLIVELSPPGRGQIVSHNLYPEWELEAVQKSVAAGASAAVMLEDADDAPTTPRSSASSSAPQSSRAEAHAADIAELKATVERLTQRLERLEKEIGLES
ncbi:MAG: DUF480 domain-containing protein [Pirellula sp.]